MRGTWICPECKSPMYSDKTIARHLQYGHGYTTAQMMEFVYAESGENQTLNRTRRGK